MGRRPATTPPRHTLNDAVDAANQIHEIRARAGDDLYTWPTPVTDDTDIDDVITYVTAHRALRPDTLAEEIAPRGVLLGYQHHRNAHRARRQLLTLLNDAHRLGVPWTEYGAAVGLPSSAAVVNRRQWLRTHLTPDPAAAPAVAPPNTPAQIVETLARELVACGPLWPTGLHESARTTPDDLADYLPDGDYPSPTSLALTVRLIVRALPRHIGVHPRLVQVVATATAAGLTT